MLSEAERLALQNRVKNFFVKNPEISKADAANHFIQEGICKKTAYNYINRELEEKDNRSKGRNSTRNSYTNKKEQKTIDKEAEKVVQASTSSDINKKVEAPLKRGREIL
ncbi:hypothetical protein BpHYR1_028672 [Brachionus plicatilis]|uniref:Uncharacterized protein n=1 Tax=Brachionus plicatilis TaxID=10195 RepID=A0A3M7T9Q2_BRAPC|nr:hypothetical protein BpHYR1_028672 [Brachionus plicatilis]